MKVWLFFVALGALMPLMSFSYAQAQLIDMMSNIAVQGQLSAQSAGQAKTALSMMQQNELLNKMNMMIVEIQTNKFGRYAGLSRASTQISLAPLDWNIGSVQSDSFFIELKNLDESTCYRFINAFSNAKSIFVNNRESTSCGQMNTVKFIFD